MYFFNYSHWQTLLAFSLICMFPREKRYTLSKCAGRIVFLVYNNFYIMYHVLQTQMSYANVNFKCSRASIYVGWQLSNHCLWRDTLKYHTSVVMLKFDLIYAWNASFSVFARKTYCEGYLFEISKCWMNSVGECLSTFTNLFSLIYFILCRVATLNRMTSWIKCCVVDSCE